MVKIILLLNLLLFVKQNGIIAQLDMLFVKINIY